MYEKVPVLALKYHFWFWPPAGLNLDLNPTPPHSLTETGVDTIETLCSFFKLEPCMWLVEAAQKSYRIYSFIVKQQDL